jgi:hypothetical protein
LEVIVEVVLVWRFDHVRGQWTRTLGYSRISI